MATSKWLVWFRVAVERRWEIAKVPWVSMWPFPEPLLGTLGRCWGRQTWRRPWRQGRGPLLCFPGPPSWVGLTHSGRRAQSEVRLSASQLATTFCSKLCPPVLSLIHKQGGWDRSQWKCCPRIRIPVQLANAQVYLGHAFAFSTCCLLCQGLEVFPGDYRMAPQLRHPRLIGARSAAKGLGNLQLPSFLLIYWGRGYGYQNSSPAHCLFDILPTSTGETVL